MTEAPPTLGFIGTGVMGASMARRLQEAGHPLVVHNRTRAKAEPLVEAGAVWADSPAAVAAQADIIFTIIGYPQDVEAVYLGEAGLVAAARPGSILVDLTTSSPRLAERITAEAAKRDIAVLDAPVSGGDVGAREGRLSIMVGGEAAAVARIRPYFELMGQTIVHQGPAGAGQHTKLCNQIVIASTMLGITEALVYARGAGLDPETVLASISGGAAGSWSLSNLAPRMLKGDFDPGFYVKHFIKDLGIAIESAHTLGLDLPGLDLAERCYQRLAELGHADKGTQALLLLYEA
ncbi:MAG: NAD(P)-dependent oxidoreductase [Opitutales bacterium]